MQSSNKFESFLMGSGDLPPTKQPNSTSKINVSPHNDPAFELGLEQGILLEKRSTARRLLAMGFDVEDTCKVTELDVNEVNELE